MGLMRVVSGSLRPAISRYEIRVGDFSPTEVATRKIFRPLQKVILFAGGVFYFPSCSFDERKDECDEFTSFHKTSIE